MKKIGILICLWIISYPLTYAKNVALIVGVNVYDTTNVEYYNRIPSLEGCINDATSFSQILQTKYHFKAQNIIHLFNEKATTDNILTTFERIEKELSKDDVFIFYFAGHGSQVENSLNDEPDHLDECLLTYDSPNGKYIRDFELGKSLDAIALKGVKVTGIIDACHSGSLLRSAVQNTRFHNINDHIDIKTKDPIIQPEAHGVVLLSASQDSQTAKELTNAQGIKHGVFTNELVNVLLFQPTNISVFELFEIVSAHLRNKNIDQLPSIVGNKERLNESIIGQSLENSSLHFPIININNNELIIQGGIFLGIFPNSILASKQGDLYKVIENIGFDKSKCISMKGSINVSENDLLYLEYRELSSTKIKVFCPQNTTAELSNYIQISENYQPYKKKLTSPILSEVSSIDDVEYFIYQTKDSIIFIRSKKAPHYLPIDFTIQKIEQSSYLQKVVNLKNLLSLPSDEDYQFPYDLNVVNRSATSPAFCLKDGNIYGLELKMNKETVEKNFQSVFDIPQRHIYVLHIDNHGFLQQIYPSMNSNTDNKFPNEVYGKEADNIVLGPQKLFKVSKPFGHETFILIASEMPIYELPWINQQINAHSEDFFKSLKPKFRSGKYQWNIKYYHYSSIYNE